MKEDYTKLKAIYEIEDLAYMMAQKLSGRDENSLNFPVESIEKMILEKKDGVLKLRLLVKWKGEWPEEEK